MNSERAVAFLAPFLGEEYAVAAQVLGADAVVQYLRRRFTGGIVVPIDAAFDPGSLPLHPAEIERRRLAAHLEAVERRPLAPPEAEPAPEPEPKPEWRPPAVAEDPVGTVFFAMRMNGVR